MLAVAVVGVPRPAAAAIAVVQGNYATPHAASSSVGIVYASAQNAGDLNVVVVGWYPGAGVNVSSVTDSKNNTYVLAVGPTASSGNATQSIYYAKNIASAAAGANVVSVNFSGSVPEADIRIEEYSGLDPVNPLDVTVAAVGSGTAPSSGAVTTTSANDLLVGADMILTGYAAAGAGFTARIVTSPNSDLLEDRVVTATGSYSATATQTGSGWWLMQLAAFRMASSGGDATPPTPPGTPTATAASSAQINLGWTASSDNVGVTGYLVERCQGAGCTSFAQIGTSTSTSYNDPGLTASTSYSYRVRATDAAGNLSGYSGTASTTTQAGATAIALVQGNYATPHAASSSVGIVYASAQNAGDLNVVVVGWYPGAGVNVSSVTDSKNNTYVLAVGPTANSGNATQSIYYAKNIASAAAGANVVSVNFSGSVPEADIRIEEYSGLDPVNPLDVTVAAVGSGTAPSSGAVTTTSANDLLVGADMILTGYAAAGAGFTARIVTSPNSDLLEDRVVTATGSYSATATQTGSGWWLMQLAAFRMASSGGDATPPTPPGTPTATAASSAQINLGWTASSDNVGVTGYLVERCQGAGCTSFAQIGTSTSTSYNDPGLTASTSYSYRVRATDAAGNLSGYSGTASTTTQAGATAIALVQGNYATPHAASSSVGIVYASAQNAGDLNVVVVGWYPGAGVNVSSVTDSKNNTYVLAVGPTANSGNATQSIYYAKNIASAAAGANVVSVNFSGSVPEADIRIEEYSGLDPVNPLDVTVAAVGSGTAPSSGAVTTTSANDLLVGADMILTGYAAAGAGFTARIVTSPNSDLLEDRVVTATGSYSATATQIGSGWWLMQLAAFRMGGSGFSAITPRHAALTLLQTQQFTTNAPGGTILNWSVDGVAGGNSSVGTVSSSGVYTPPASPGTHTVSATNSLNPANTVSVTVAVTDLSGITTYHSDTARTGQNLHEYALTPAMVSSGAFGKRWSCTLDGTAYAQPLYVANLSIGGGTHNVLFVVTEHDSIYAFDADAPGCVTYWHVSLINPPAITATSNAISSCDDILTEYGITGTPVIDPSFQTIYLVAATTENGAYFQRLHALNIATGAERVNPPTVIQATVPGTGDGGSTVSFNPGLENQRLGLTFTQGGVVIGWSSHCDDDGWYGWIMRYDATSLQQTAVFNSTPNQGEGGIWMSGGAPALDSNSNMFFSTGNGGFDDTTDTVPALSPHNDLGESFVNLNPQTLVLQDLYTPSQTAAWTSADLDISSAGITVLPDGVGPTAHPNVLVGADKQGHLWMIDRNHMSGYLPNADNTVQYLTLPNLSVCYLWCVFSTPGYWNGTVYVASNWGHLLALRLSGGLIPQNGQVPIVASQSAETYGFPAPTPVISASPSGGAIVWALDNLANGTEGNGSTALGPAILRAYDATNLGTTLYSSTKLAADAAGNAAKFTLPVVANGHVYVAGAGTLTVYGLAP